MMAGWLSLMVQLRKGSQWSHQMTAQEDLILHRQAGLLERQLMEEKVAWPGQMQGLAGVPPV